MNSKSKRQLRVPDRISGLPDALLWHILSFVETQDAVRTCVLSTRWKNIWASVPTLDFDQTSFHDPDKFWAFVDYVLLFRHSSNIKKFRLYMKGKDVDHSRINAWINTAIRRNVVELDLLAGHPFLSKLVELPKSLFMCKTLVILRLRSQFITNIPASGCFPSLKFLHVTFYSNVIESMRELFSNCPILEDLTVDGLLLYGVSLNLNISVPALKTLRIWFDKDGDDNGASSYFINCPKLENLDVIEEFSSTYCWGKAKSLVKASICLPQHCSNGQPSFYRVKSLLAGISSVTDLCLSAHCFEVGCCPQEDSDNDEGSLYEEDSESEEGSEHEEGSENERRSDHEEGSVNEQGSEHRWNPPDCVPKCCLLHLKIVSTRGFMGERDELEVAKYLLKYGQVLNKMTISMDHLDVNEKEKIYEEFLMVPKGSRTSIVEFI